jgi:hypothetical protein
VTWETGRIKSILWSARFVFPSEILIAPVLTFFLLDELDICMDSLLMRLRMEL